MLLAQLLGQETVTENKCFWLFSGISNVNSMKSKVKQIVGLYNYIVWVVMP